MDTTNILTGTTLAAILADTQSTKDLLKRGGTETNPLLNRKPSGGDLDKAALLSGLGAYAASQMLPDSVKNTALGGWTGLEAGLAYQNAHLNTSGARSSLHKQVSGAPAVLGVLGAGLGYMLPKDMQFQLGLGATSDGSPAVTFNRGF